MGGIGHWHWAAQGGGHSRGEMEKGRGVLVTVPNFSPDQYGVGTVVKVPFLHCGRKVTYKVIFIGIHPFLVIRTQFIRTSG